MVHQSSLPHPWAPQLLGLQLCGWAHLSHQPQEALESLLEFLSPMHVLLALAQSRYHPAPAGLLLVSQDFMAHQN